MSSTADKAAAKLSAKEEKTRLKQEQKNAKSLEKIRKNLIKLEIQASKAAQKAAKVSKLPPLNSSSPIDSSSNLVIFAELPESYQSETMPKFAASGAPAEVGAGPTVESEAAVTTEPRRFSDPTLVAAAGKVAELQQAMSFAEFNDLADMVEEDVSPEWMTALAGGGDGDLIDEDALQAMFGDGAVVS
jgi:hypothetical protein